MRTIDSWKIVKRIALVFGIVFIVFAGIAAVVNYELDTVLYVATAPAKLIDMSVLTAALPFIVAAVLSFMVEILSSSAISSEAKSQEAEAQAKQEAEEHAQREAEEQAEQEIAFEETREAEKEETSIAHANSKQE